MLRRPLDDALRTSEAPQGTRRPGASNALSPRHPLGGVTSKWPFPLRMMPTSAQPATSSYADRGSLQRLPRPRPLAHRRDEGGDGGPTDFPAGAALRPSCLTWPERRRPLPGPTDPTGLSLGWVSRVRASSDASAAGGALDGTTE